MLAWFETNRGYATHGGRTSHTYGKPLDRFEGHDAYDA